MAERIRREVLENQLKRIAELLGKPSGNPWSRVGDRNIAKVGTLCLDYAACYGGYNVEEICNESGGVRHPFGDRRLKADAFWSMLNGIEYALRIASVSQHRHEWTHEAGDKAEKCAVCPATKAV